MQPHAPYPLNLLRDGLHRRCWWVRLVLAAVLVPWFGYFAYTRITARPAKPFANWSLDAGLAVPDPAVDRTRDLVATMASLPAFPVVMVSASAPAGMEWVDARTLKARRGREESSSAAAGESPSATLPAFGTGIPSGTGTAGATFTVSPNIGLVGRWMPSARYHLGELVKYLEMPATQQALDQFVALSDKPFCLSHGSVLAGRGLFEARQMTRLLVARSRWYLAGKHDLDKAIRDIDAALHVAAGLEDDQTLLCVSIGIGCRSTAVGEVIRWTQEFALSEPQIRALQHLLARHRPAPLRQMELAIRGESLLTLDLIDQMYTGDGRGNGWYVPMYGQPNLAENQAMRILNLLSPVFEGRQTAEAQTRRFWAAVTAELAKPGVADSSSRMHAGFLPPPVWKPTSPSFPFEEVFRARRVRLHALRGLASFDGAAVAMALAAYRNRHGRYPDQLSQLVPEHLAAVPADPFSGRPLRYRLEGAGYLLYSIDANGLDDNGVRRDGGNDLDWPIAPATRPEADEEEWFLVVVGGSRVAE